MKTINYKIDKNDLYLFNQGTNYFAYMTFGAHIIDKGVRFAVFAPHAKAVSVVGDFNDWDESKNPMQPIGEHGVWVANVKNACEGQLYKYKIVTHSGGELYKADPYAYRAELRPGTASIIAANSYEWTDASWMEKREKTPPYNNPMNIYEVHLGSFITNEDGTYKNYRELAHILVEYAKKMNYTHLEIMPISEYPFDASWGYQVTSYYAPTSRYGTGSDFKYFIDYCHQNDIAVICDWVPAHFPKDEFALAEFDGEPLYEYADSRKGEHKTWGTKVFDFSKNEVRSFLISNAMYWLKEYHVDGLRIDAVSSMLYLDYDRRDGEWIPNIDGGNINLEAKSFLQELNREVFARFPNVIMAAEESTAFPMITHPIDNGGLGFNYKWNMGWMHDILDYFQMDPYFRQFNHNKITFSMHYAFSENFILPFSHDEVVHGKKSMLDKMWGQYEDKFAQLRALLMYMYAHPGKKLNFMGTEIGEFLEWRFYEGLEWNLLDYDMHKKLQHFVSSLGMFYKKNKALWENDNDWDGFEWISADDANSNTISFIRSDKKRASQIILVCNFGPIFRDRFKLGVSSEGEYSEIFNTDATEFGGENRINKKRLVAKEEEFNYRPYSIEFDLPPFSVVALRKVKKRKDTKSKKPVVKKKKIRD